MSGQTEFERTRDTHELEGAKEVRSQESGRKRGTHGLESAEGHVKTPRETSERGALTTWIIQGGQVRKSEDSKRARDTHGLSSIE
jgi:hypothetical protein